MKLLFIMDPYESLNQETETSLLLMDELLERGHQVFWLEPDKLSLQQNEPVGLIAQVISVSPFSRLAEESVSLNSFDGLLTRIDPPFDQNYLHVSYILDYLGEHVVQFNPASALRNFNEKLLALHWPELVPPTIVSQNSNQILDFLNLHGEVILKPLDDCSGRGVVKLVAGQANVHELIQKSLRSSVGKLQYIQAQKFLGAVSEGDKRVYLLNGDPVGVVNRLPQAGNYLANIHQGARCEASKLSSRELAIIEQIKTFLLREGIVLSGLDLIGGYITELNITSPSAIRQINEVSGLEVHKTLVDGIETKIKDNRQEMCCGIRLLKAG